MISDLVSLIGGKGAGLQWLNKNINIGYSVPEFEIIDTTFYDDFLKQQKIAQLNAIFHSIIADKPFVGLTDLTKLERLEDKCNKLAKKFEGKGIAVRSSAVNSEDSNFNTGAGIYRTILLEQKDWDSKALIDAVLQVYASVDTEKANVYREKVGIKNEKMAVVVQELSKGYGWYNGVFMSRLPSNKRVATIAWSDELGAVVNGDNRFRINRVNFHVQRDGLNYYDYRVIFAKEGNEHRALNVRNVMGKIVSGLKKEYRRDFLLEFSANFDKKEVNLLQIRPMTNLQNIEIEFPKDKRAIYITDKGWLRSGYCMGAGEIVGKAVFEQMVYNGWKEPNEPYVLIAQGLGQTLQRVLGKKDYHALTPNKEALVITHEMVPESHALTIAHEEGILCIGANTTGHERIYEGDIDYVKVVSDGIIGKVYKATKEEALEFDRRR